MGKQAAGGTDAVVKLCITRSSANFGTFTGATASKNDPNDGETIQTTCGSNASVEPTSPTDGGLWWEVQPQSGASNSFRRGWKSKCLAVNRSSSKQPRPARRL